MSQTNTSFFFFNFKKNKDKHFNNNKSRIMHWILWRGKKKSMFDCQMFGPFNEPTHLKNKYKTLSLSPNILIAPFIFFKNILIICDTSKEAYIFPTPIQVLSHKFYLLIRIVCIIRLNLFNNLILFNSLCFHEPQFSATG